MARGGDKATTKAAAGAVAACSCALLLLPGAAADFRTKAGDYTPTSDRSKWERYCNLPGGVRAVRGTLAPPMEPGELGWGKIDWETVREAYENSVQEFATEEFPGTPYWETNSQYYGSPRWIDVLAEKNLNNEVGHYHGHDHYGDHDDDNLEARVRLFERIMLDQVSSHLMMGLLQAAANGDQGAWDAAAAVYTGCGNDNTGPDNTLYGRSDSVGMHFGTLSEDDTSLTNYEVLEAFQDGPENVIIVEQAVRRTAWQSLLRYAHLLDGHFENESDWLEHQALGWGAWRVLEGLVALDDPERAAAITALFSMQSDAPVPLLPNNYCYLVTVLEEDLGLANDEAFGNFADAMNVDCDTVEPLEFPAENVHDGHDDRDDHGDHDNHDDHDGHDDRDDHGDHDNHDDHDDHDP